MICGVIIQLPCMRDVIGKSSITPASEITSETPVSVQEFNTNQNGIGACASLTSCQPVLSQPQLTTQQIQLFNKLPNDMTVFYQQMESGNFYGVQYSKSRSTKSSYAKRKLVHQFIRDYSEKCLHDFNTKSPTWIYENKIKSRCQQ